MVKFEQRPHSLDTHTEAVMTKWGHVRKLLHNGWDVRKMTTVIGHEGTAAVAGQGRPGSPLAYSLYFYVGLKFSIIQSYFKRQPFSPNISETLCLFVYLFDSILSVLLVLGTAVLSKLPIFPWQEMQKRLLPLGGILHHHDSGVRPL